MFTYIVYHGNEKDGYGEASEMFCSAEEQGILRCFEIPDIQSEPHVNLIRDIDGFCGGSVGGRWQLLFIENDPSACGATNQIYSMYCKIVEYIEQYLLPHLERKPEKIYIVVSTDAYVQRSVQGADFFTKIPGNYRLLLYRSSKGIAGYDAWRLFCNTLILMKNETVQVAIEYGGIYMLEWIVDYNLASAFLVKSEDCLKQIREQLSYYLQIISHRKNSVLPEFSNRIVYLGESKKTVQVKKKAFPCFNNAGDIEAEKWRIDNDAALKGMQKLWELPLGRWEQEIEENRKDEIPEMAVSTDRAKDLTKEAMAELQRRKEVLAEAIYGIGLHDEEIRSMLKESMGIEKKLEYSIKTRMSDRVCIQATAEWMCAVLMLFTSWLYAHTYSDSQENKVVLFVGFLSLILYIVVQIILSMERTWLRKQINKKLEQIDKLTETDDKSYQQLLQKVLQHKKYCYYEAGLKRKKKDKEKLVQNLKNHNHAAERAIRFITFLARILEISPLLRPETEEQVTVDYGRDPQECKYYYFPYGNFWNTDILQNIGSDIQIPYPFIKKCSLRKIPIVFK